MRNTLLFAAAAVLASELACAQSNSRGAGYDPALYDIFDIRFRARRGAAYPNGEAAFTFANGLCNRGSIPVDWYEPMNPNHPMWGFMIAKQVDGRMIQLTDKPFVKHAFYALRNNVCGTCVAPPTAPGVQLGVSCSDIYSYQHNGDRNYLGPASEVDPWLGVWQPVGSFFDRGFPDVGPPSNTNGARSTITPTDNVMNRLIVREADLVGANNGLFFSLNVIANGEPAQNRGNNAMTRQFAPTWNGTSWTPNIGAAATVGTVLTRWTGASLSLGGNGNDDGRFQVGVKVTGPTNGLWHYEFAVLNLDNHRGGAAFRIPVCADARVVNIGFRDPDANPLNGWTANRTGGELAFLAAAGNPLDWNTMFNFWFDSDAAPVAGTVAIDQARLGGGAPQVQVGTSVPGFLPHRYLGAGCGTPTVDLSGNGTASIPAPGFALRITTTPATGVLVFNALNAANLPLGSGCFQYLDAGSLATHGFFVSDAGGVVQVPFGIPPGLTPADLFWQAASLANGGPALGIANLSNGLAVRIGGTGCQ